MRTEGASGVPCSPRLRETTGPTLQSSQTSGGPTEFWDDPKTAGAAVSPTFHTHWPEDTKFDSTGQPGVRQIGSIDFLNR